MPRNFCQNQLQVWNWKEGRMTWLLPLCGASHPYALLRMLDTFAAYKLDEQGASLIIAKSLKVSASHLNGIHIVLCLWTFCWQLLVENRFTSANILFLHPDCYSYILFSVSVWWAEGSSCYRADTACYFSRYGAPKPCKLRLFTKLFCLAISLWSQLFHDIHENK